MKLCANHLPIRLGSDRYVWRPCLKLDGHRGPCEIDRTIPSKEPSELVTEGEQQ